MDKKLKTKWLRALRSGKYKQGPGSYYSHGAYCCLGVLGCLITGKSGEVIYKENGFSDHLTPLVQQPMWGTLVAMNDDGKSFAEIADYIEKNL